MFSGQYKWLSIFGLLCLLSAVYSATTTVLRSVGLQTLLSHICTRDVFQLIRDEDDILAFVRATFGSASLVVVVSVWNAFADPSAGFEGGVSVTVRRVCSNRRPCVSFVLYTPLLGHSWLAGYLQYCQCYRLGGYDPGRGKAGIVGGFLSAILFFLIKRKLGSVIALLGGMVV